MLMNVLLITEDNKFKMQVQQQLTWSKGNHVWNKGYVNQDPVTVEQIYEIDTISLEQLVEDFEGQSFFGQIVSGQKGVNLSGMKISSSFSGLSCRQLRNWYKLARMQMQERRKIEQFAMKLMEEQIESDELFYLRNMNSAQNPFLKTKKNNEDHKSTANQPLQVKTVLWKTEQISIKLPPINDPKSASRSKLPKLQDVIQSSNLQPLKKQPDVQLTLKRSESSHKKSRTNLIAQILSKQTIDPNPSNSFTNNKTLQRLKQPSKTIETTIQQTPGVMRKENKGLSKKQFLQMMKIKLNGGTDYKTGSFIKQQSKSQLQNHSITNTNKTKRKQVQHQTIRKMSNYSSNSQVERAKTQSTYVGSSKKMQQSSKRMQITPGIISSKKIVNPSTVSVDMSKGNHSTQQNFRSRGNSTYTARQYDKNRKVQSKPQAIESSKINKTQSGIVNVSQTINLSQQFRVNLTDTPNVSLSHSTNEGLEDNKFQSISIVNANKKGNQQQANVKFVSKQQADDSSQEVLSIICNREPDNSSQETLTIICNGKGHNTINQRQLFIENEDAYDDEPQVLQNQVFLHQEQIKQTTTQYSVSKKDIQLNQQNNLILSHHIEHQSLTSQPSHNLLQQNYPLNDSQPLKDRLYHNFINQNHLHSLQHHPLQQSKSPQNINIDKKSSSQIHSLNQQHSHILISQTQSPIQIQSSQTINKSHNPTSPKFNPNSLCSLQSKTFLNSDPNPPKPKPIANTNILAQNSLISRIRPISAKPLPKYPPYHLQFPSFSHLFNIKSDTTSNNNKSKLSLPHLLKSLQYSLQMYFHKNVSKIALEQMNNRISLITNQSISHSSATSNDLNQVNLQFKCITQLQFVNSSEGKSLFDIDLASFKEKSYALLKKLKSNYLPSNFDQQSSSKNPSKNHLKQKQNDHLFYRVVKNKPEVYDIINTSFYRTQNWLQLPHGMDLQGCWNFLWTWSKPQIDFNTLIKFQKVNHFPGSKELARKDLLKKNIQKIKKMSKKLNEYFDIIPETFFLPGQNVPFIKKFRQSQNLLQNLWILKPVGMSRGRGISLINRLEQVVFSEPIVMQKYIHNPFLLDGFKFDLRIYVLVTSINPLECFIYKEGFARVSTERYCNDVEEIGNKFVHLTNYSIQKDSAKYPDMFTQRQKELGGCKLTLKMLQNRLQKMNIQWDTIWDQVQEVVLKSLISCMKYIPQNANCFELFGYDIMLDEDLKCWLIEVNSSPSLEKDFIIDEIVKQQLVDDIIEVVEPVDFDRCELLKVVKRRRKQFEGLKSHVNYSNNSAEQLNEDLFKILKGKSLRNYGQIREHKNFKCIAPGVMYEKIVKTVQHFTHDPFVKNENFY